MKELRMKKKKVQGSENKQAIFLILGTAVLVLSAILLTLNEKNEPSNQYVKACNSKDQCYTLRADLAEYNKCDPIAGGVAESCEYAVKVLKVYFDNGGSLEFKDCKRGQKEYCYSATETNNEVGWKFEKATKTQQE